MKVTIPRTKEELCINVFSPIILKMQKKYLNDAESLSHYIGITQIWLLKNSLNPEGNGGYMIPDKLWVEILYQSNLLPPKCKWY